MSIVFKKGTSVVLFVVAMIFFFDYFWKDSTLQGTATNLNNWVVVIAAFALGLGAYSLIVRHAQIIRKRGMLMPYSIALLVTMFTFIITGLVTHSISSPQYSFIYNSIIVPASQALYGMSSFFIASASYRALRAKSYESLVCLAAAMFILFLNAPIFGVINPILPSLGKIVWDASVSTGMRAILIGIGIGTLTTGLRIIIGQDKAPLGGGD